MLYETGLVYFRHRIFCLIQVLCRILNRACFGHVASTSLEILKVLVLVHLVLVSRNQSVLLHRVGLHRSQLLLRVLVSPTKREHQELYCSPLFQLLLV